MGSTNDNQSERQVAKRAASTGPVTAELERSPTDPDEHTKRRRRRCCRRSNHARSVDEGLGQARRKLPPQSPGNAFDDVVVVEECAAINCVVARDRMFAIDGLNGAPIAASEPIQVVVSLDALP